MKQRKQTSSIWRYAMAASLATGLLASFAVPSMAAVDYAGGYYAYPFYGYQHGHGYGHRQGWNPGDRYYTLPYAEGDIAELRPHAYKRFL